MTLESCEKEIKDRIDVADVLHLESELMRRQDYLRKANLFADNVHQMHDVRERDEYIDLMGNYSEY
jgi:predicted ABC-type exoprotein transport system permease subunit